MVIFMQNNRDRQDGLGHRIERAVEVPKDISLGAPILTLIGYNEVCVENYRGIIEYTDAFIRIQTKIGQIRITGKRLQIEYYTNDEMKVTGKIMIVECCHY